MEEKQKRGSVDRHTSQIGLKIMVVAANLFYFSVVGVVSSIQWRLRQLAPPQRSVIAGARPINRLEVPGDAIEGVQFHVLSGSS